MNNSSQAGASVASDMALGSWPGHTGNWGRWSNDAGTLNLVTPEAVLRGIRTVQQGEVIPCSRPVFHKEPLQPTVLFEHEMTHVHDMPEPTAVKTQSAGDMLTFRVHNLVNTHIDALSHIGHNGYTFNGHRFRDVVSETEGAKKQDITCALGVVTRGLFIDIASARGVEFLEPGDVVRPEELSELAARVEPGDAVIVRTGSTLSGGRPPIDPDDRRGFWSGLHPDCIELLGQRGISLIGGDAVESFPSPLPAISPAPMHVMCLVVYGIHIVHHMDLERLAVRCRALGRDDFLFTVNALNVPGATGSPVTPVAVL